MNRKLRLLGSFAALAGFWAFQSQAPLLTPTQAAAADAPVVVELFTSQSCSSCPPADEVLADLAERENIIALGCHVTYWDHLNWKDTLSLPACTQRQRTYAAQMGSAQVYTPQMVVNGRVEFVGSNRGRALNAVDHGTIDQGTGALKTIPLSRLGDTLEAQLPALDPGQGPQALLLAPIAMPLTQAIKSGENRGRTVTYTNPVASLVALGAWDGTAQTRTFSLPPSTTGLQSYALLAQNPTTGALSAAGKLDQR